MTKPNFAKASMGKGKLLVFEGIDGSGKTTQIKLLLNYLKQEKLSFKHYSFPRYEMPWGKMVRRYLDGEFGNVDAVNPYLASVLYAGDRFAAAEEIGKNLNMGKIVLGDRYIGSNIAHQAAKMQDQNDKSKFIDWVEDFEYKQNRIPKEDLVILLSIPSQISQRLMSAKKKDIHEADGEYLAKVSDVYDQLAKDKTNWVRIDCVGGGKLRKLGEIHKEVLAILMKNNILRTK